MKPPPNVSYRQRVSERVDDRSGGKTRVGKLPQLLHARPHRLRLAAFVEAQARDRLLCERSAGSLAQHHHAREDICAGLVVRFRLPL